MMDVDLYHDVRVLNKLIEAADDADIVAGSRYVKDGQILGWSLKRRIISKGATAIANLVLGVGIKDPMSGCALFKRDLFRDLRSNFSPRGYKLLLEILVKSPNAVIKEVPPIFQERANGKSKMGPKEISDYLKLCYDLWSYKRLT